MKEIYSPKETRYLLAKAAEVIVASRGVNLTEAAKILKVKEDLLRRAMREFSAL